jgi:hypothetical protein
MAKVALVLALVAAGLSGALAWDRWGGCAKCHGGSDTEVRAASDVDARLAALEARMKAEEEKAPAALATTSDLGSAPASGSGSTLEGRRSATVPAGSDSAAADPMAAVEKRLAALEEYRTKTEEWTKRAPLPTTYFAGRGGMYTSFDEAAKDLELDDGQKADWERILADSRREIDELRRIPDEEGNTMEGLQREMLTGMTDGGSRRFDFSKIVAQRQKRIPGRSETYGEADKRVRDSAKTRLRATLSAPQQSKFDKTSVDPLLSSGALGSQAIQLFTAPPAGGR